MENAVMFTAATLEMLAKSSKVTLAWSQNTHYSMVIDASNERSTIYMNMSTLNESFAIYFFNFFNNLAFSTFFDPGT